MNPWLIHVNEWQKPLKYCKVISLQLKKNWKNKYSAEKLLFFIKYLKIMFFNIFLLFKGEKVFPSARKALGMNFFSSRPKRFGHSKQPLPTTQEKTLHVDITRWSTPKSDWLYSLQPKMEKVYTVSKNKTGSWLWLRPWTPYCQIQTQSEESGENHKTIQVWPK